MKSQVKTMDVWKDAPIMGLKDNLKIIQEEWGCEVLNVFESADKRYYTIVYRDFRGTECDNDYDCEHCDWVECPIENEGKV
jgi:hypothetical protein